MKRLTLFSFVFVALFLGISSTSHATLTSLWLFDGINPEVKITDNMAGDANPLTGVVTYNGPMGGWLLTVATGVSAPVYGSAEWPELDLVFVAMPSGTTKDLNMWLTTTDFTGLGPSGFSWEIGGTLESTVSYAVYYDPGNNPFGTTQLLGTLGPYTTSPFGGAGGAGVVLSAPYSLTLAISMTLDVKDIISGDANLKAVPEPGTLLLLGSGMLGFSIFARYRRGKKA